MTVSPTGPLSSKVAIVTGASGGVGRAIALRFEKDGATVIAAGASGRQNAVAAESQTGRIVPIHCDVTREGDIAQLIGTCKDRFGRLDILCNNSGIGLTPKLLHEASPEDWDRVMGVNARGAFLVTRGALPLMIDTGGGSIINIGSVASHRATAGTAIYAASKGGLLMLTRATALDYVADSIRANIICPGTLATPLLDKHDAEFVNALSARIPMGRLGEPEEVAALAAFLASDDASYITGQSYIVDGGRCAG